MTTAANANPTPAELIRQRATEMMEDRDGDLALADAMLTILAERDALAEILAEVRAYADGMDPAHLDETPLWPSTIRGILSKLPADALAAVQGRAWHEGAVAALASTDPMGPVNPYRIEREADNA